MEYIFKIEPVAKGRPKFSSHNGFSRAYTPTKTRRFESEIALIAKSLHIGDAMDCPIGVDIKFFLSRPKSVSEKNRPYPSVKPDCENLCKSFIDGCNGIIWKDDALICKIEASKEYSSDKGFIVLKIFKL